VTREIGFGAVHEIDEGRVQKLENSYFKAPYDWHFYNTFKKKVLHEIEQYKLEEAHLATRQEMLKKKLNTLHEDAAELVQ
jgi:hypothetical protein